MLTSDMRHTRWYTWMWTLQWTDEWTCPKKQAGERTSEWEKNRLNRCVRCLFSLPYAVFHSHSFGGLASLRLSSSCLVGAVIVLVCGFFSYRRKAMLIPLQLSLSVVFSLCTFTISTTYKFDVCTHRQNQWLKIRAYSTESATATSYNNNIDAV